MKRILSYATLVLLLVVAGGAWFAYQQYTQFTQTPIQLVDGKPVIFEVKAGSNIRQVARQLVEAGIVQQHAWLPSDLMLVAQARLTDSASRIRAGEYELKAGMTPADVLRTFVSGKTVQYQLGIVEGRTFRDLVQVVRNSVSLVQTLNEQDYADLMPKLGAAPGTHPEGWFFPDTYSFPRGTTDLELLQRSYQTMQNYLTKVWDSRVPHPHITTPYEALILASIVEKETGVPEERPLIARVFLSRLEKGMMLQTDPTVIYGIGARYDGNIRKKDLQTDTPYNTYTRHGLPPTPIAIPSKAAIDAVLHPADSPYLYFVATGTGDGRHYFSKTYEEHRKAVIQYQLNGRAERYQGGS